MKSLHSSLTDVNIERYENYDWPINKIATSSTELFARAYLL